jgi:hypothetical protein
VTISDADTVTDALSAIVENGLSFEATIFTMAIPVGALSALLRDSGPLTEAQRHMTATPASTKNTAT